MEVMKCYYMKESEVLAYAKGYGMRNNINLYIIRQKKDVPQKIYFIDDKYNVYTLLQILKDTISDKIDFIEINYSPKTFEVMVFVRKQTKVMKKFEDGFYEKEICTV